MLKQYLKNLFSPKVYYFAYGSNMSLSRIEKRVGKVKSLGHTRVKGFQLTFDTGNDKGSFANVKLDENSFVEGVTYELSEKQLRILDYYEGAPLFYERMWDFDSLGNLVCIYINERKRETKNRPTTSDYLETLIKGATENKMPTKYIEYLHSIPKTKVDNLYQ